MRFKMHFAKDFGESQHQAGKGLQSTVEQLNPGQGMTPATSLDRRLSQFARNDKDDGLSKLAVNF